MKEKVVLAYSGGLDTSVILHWLLQKGYNVIAFEADLGQPGESYAESRQKALDMGASKFILRDLKEELVTDFIFPTIWANARYEEKYLLGTSLARPLTAREQVKIAEEEKAKFVAHGSTGKGNDQIRFEMAYKRLNPSLGIIAPFKDPEFLKQFPGRKEEIDYCEKHNIPIKTTRKKPYSSDENLAHISYEAGELEKIERSPLEYPLPKKSPFKKMFRMGVLPEKAPDKPAYVRITFEKGNPVRIEDESGNIAVSQPVELFQYANQVAGSNGCGIIDIVENRYLGMKSRGVYEAPGHTLLLEAHKALEQICLDREVMHECEDNMPKFARLVYNGQWFSPEFQYLKSWYQEIQQNVNGTIRVKLYKGNIVPIERYSPYSLYSELDASMMELGGVVEPLKSRGFIDSLSIRHIANFDRERRVADRKTEKQIIYTCEKCGKSFPSLRLRNGPKYCKTCIAELRKQGLGPRQIKKKNA